MAPDDNYAHGYPIKLVRDHIGERLGGGGTLTYRPVESRAEHVDLLRKKLIEEVAEYLLAPSIDELADVFEAVIALGRREFPGGDIFAVAHAKRHERGGFQQGVVMVGHHEADGRELLPQESPDA